MNKAEAQQIADKAKELCSTVYVQISEYEPGCIVSVWKSHSLDAKLFTIACTYDWQQLMLQLEVLGLLPCKESESIICVGDEYFVKPLMSLEQGLALLDADK